MASQTSRTNRLRELAQHYASGALESEAYRQQRREFIDAVTGGTCDLGLSSPADQTVPSSLHRTRRSRINVPVLLMTAGFIAILTLMSLYLIRGPITPYTPADPNADTEIVASD